MPKLKRLENQWWADAYSLVFNQNGVNLNVTTTDV
jgi:hypothetical protein